MGGVSELRQEDDDEDAPERLPKHRVHRVTWEATASEHPRLRQVEVTRGKMTTHTMWLHCACELVTKSRQLLSDRTAAGRATCLSHDGEFIDHHFAMGRGSEPATVWALEDFTD